MQKLAVVLVVLLGLVSVGLAIDPPQPGSTVGYPVNVTLQYSAVIGQNDTTGTGSNNLGPNTFSYIQGLTWFAGNYSSKLGGSGLFAADSDSDRGLFFNANNLNAPAAYNYAFGVANSTDTGSLSFYKLDYTANGVYALVYNTIIYYWSFSTLTLAFNPFGNNFPNPDYTFGNTTSYDGLSPYISIDNAYDMITKKSTGDIFVADYSCSRIVVYPASNTANPAPSFVIGQNDTNSCSSCSTYSPTTCFDSNPQWITFDCYEGLWVYAGVTFYYFPNNSKIATFTFNATDDLYGHFSDAHGLVQGPGCNYLTFLADEEAVFILQVNYGSIGGVYSPTSVQSVLTFGSTYNSNNNNPTNTGSLGDVHGAAYNGQTGYFADYDYSRIVALNFSSIITNSGVPSIVAASNGAASASQSNIPRTTSTATAAALSSGASQYPSSTNTPSAIFSTEASESESNSPIYYYTGATTQLSSWVDLVQF